MIGSPKKHTLIIIENLPAPFDRRVWAEATSLRDADIGVSIICPMLKGYDADFEIVEGIHIYRHPLKEAGKSKFGYFSEYAQAVYHQCRLAWKVKKEREFDVIHACNPPDLIFVVAFLFRIVFGTRFIFDHHDLCPELFIAKFGKPKGFKKILFECVKLFEKITFSLADVSIATNESYKKIAIERGGMKAEDVFVVRSGPKLDNLKILPPDPTTKNGFSFMLGYVGVIGEQEGLDLLVEAADHLVNKIGRTDAQFVIIGDGPAREDVMALAENLGLSKYFSFLGRVDDEVFLRVLNSADVCVNSDRFCAMNDKSTMNKILEYMALAKPIVQFDLFEGRQSAGEASLYAKPDDTVDFANKINILLEDAQLRRKLGAIGHERVVKKLAWKYSIPGLLRAYSKVLSLKEEPEQASDNLTSSRIEAVE